MSERQTYTCPKCKNSWSLSQQDFDVATWDGCCHECYDPDEGMGDDDES